VRQQLFFSLIYMQGTTFDKRGSFYVGRYGGDGVRCCCVATAIPLPTSKVIYPDSYTIFSVEYRDGI